MTDTLERADGVATRGVFVTGVVDVTLVDVVTIPASEAVQTFDTTGCHAAVGVTTVTVAVTLTILAPSAARTSCNKTNILEHCVFY